MKIDKEDDDNDVIWWNVGDAANTLGPRCNISTSPASERQS